MMKHLRRTELVVDGKAVHFMSDADSHVLEPKYRQVRDLSIASLYESWHKANQFDPDTHVVIGLDDDQRLPWEGNDDDVWITKEGGQLVCSFNILTAYPGSRESYSALVKSIDMGNAFSVESVGMLAGGMPRGGRAGREWDTRLICKFLSSTFEDLFKVRKDIARATFDARDYEDSRGLIFRIYIPSDRLYSVETDKLIALFHEWLSNTGRNDVRLDRYRTPTGQAYEFFSEEFLNRQQLSREFNSFSNLLDLCVRSPSAAVVTLSRMGVKPALAEMMVARYGREARRLELELGHERESRILVIRHSLESELLDVAVDAEQWTRITSLIDSLVPNITNIGTMSLPALPKTEPISVSINQQFVNAVESTVIQNVHGETNLGSQAKELLDLVRQFGQEQVVELESAIHELEDPAMPQSNHSRAKERIKSFLRQLGGKVEDAALTALMKYLDAKFIK
jgi:hypothetical protein